MTIEVERLAEAVYRVISNKSTVVTRGDGSPVEHAKQDQLLRTWMREDAEKIAAEYSRLSEKALAEQREPPGEPR